MLSPVLEIYISDDQACIICFIPYKRTWHKDMSFSDAMDKAIEINHILFDDVEYKLMKKLLFYASSDPFNAYHICMNENDAAFFTLKFPHIKLSLLNDTEVESLINV